MGLILFLLVSYYPLGLEISENDLSFEEMFSLSLMFFVTLIFLILLLLFREVIWGSSEQNAETK